ncbi:hypothetical protein O3W44_22820 [Pantoea sp. LMR881]|uniref:hypothetical protein n=1 Tax=Pantoea sp. LMR881 TaxID=3014336 RepID=UPI0022B0281C|nr:hypothetical protein [Pantoea sp. LMR881]MCZ4061368.1 hypothetical protein [Pantoea sp. LMR881]
MDDRRVAVLIKPSVSAFCGGYLRCVNNLTAHHGKHFDELAVNEPLPPAITQQQVIKLFV